MTYRGAVREQTDSQGRVTFVACVLDARGRIVRYVPLGMSEDRAEVVAGEMAEDLVRKLRIKEDSGGQQKGKSRKS